LTHSLKIAELARRAVFAIAELLVDIVLIWFGVRSTCVSVIGVILFIINMVVF